MKDRDIPRESVGTFSLGAEPVSFKGKFLGYRYGDRIIPGFGTPMRVEITDPVSSTTLKAGDVVLVSLNLNIKVSWQNQNLEIL